MLKYALLLAIVVYLCTIPSLPLITHSPEDVGAEPLPEDIQPFRPVWIAGFNLVVGSLLGSSFPSFNVDSMIYIAELQTGLEDWYGDGLGDSKLDDDFMTGLKKVRVFL